MKDSRGEGNVTISSGSQKKKRPAPHDRATVHAVSSPEKKRNSVKVGHLESRKGSQLRAHVDHKSDEKALNNGKHL